MPTMPAVERALEKVKKALKAKARFIAVTGLPGSGKSTVLERLRNEWKGSATPALLRFPKGEDGGLTALASLGASLYVFDPRLDEALRATTSFKQKLDVVLDRVKKQKLTVLLDEPAPFPRDESLQTPFDGHARAVFDGVVRSGTTIVCAAVRPPPHADECVRVEGPSDTGGLLDPARWNGQGQVARQLRARAADLQHFNPLELRLVVQLSSFEGLGFDRIRSAGWRLDELLREFFLRVPDAGALKKLVAELALVRIPLTPKRYQQLTRGADAATRKLLEHVLLYQEGDAWHVHEAIAGQASSKGWLTSTERRAAHGRLAAQSKAAFTDAVKRARLSEALRWEMETIHHRTEAADATLLDDSLVFIEQYDNCGRRLGVEGVSLMKRGADGEGRALLNKAVAAYARALEHDSHDWYARHYSAFNRDLLGEDPELIQADYERAIDDNPVFVWAHSRYLRFLVATSQLTLFRSAWARAKQHVPLSDVRVYEELHCDVAMTLLHFAQPALAQLVLDDVPQGVRSMLRHHQLLTQLALAEEEALRDELVFPPSVAVPSRWEGPHLLPENQRAEVTTWTPGRVVARSKGSLRLRVARRSDTDVEYGWQTLKPEEVVELGATDLQPGAFVELVHLGAEWKLLRHPPTGAYFEPVRLRFPDPLRFAP